VPGVCRCPAGILASARGKQKLSYRVFDSESQGCVIRRLSARESYSKETWQSLIYLTSESKTEDWDRIEFAAGSRKDAV